MNRCSIPIARWRAHMAALGAVLLALPALGQWQEPQRIPPIPAHAVRGVLEVTAPPEVLLDGQPARLAPGARIRDRNNLMVVSGALIGQKHTVRYTRDPLGLLLEVWVLTPAEVAASAPAQPPLLAH